MHGVAAKDIEGYTDFFNFVFQRSDRKPENRLHYNYSFDQWRSLSGEDIDPLDFEKKIMAYHSQMNILVQQHSPIGNFTGMIFNKKYCSFSVTNRPEPQTADHKP